jgi:predicted GNAT family N-acyltransferase
MSERPSFTVKPVYWHAERDAVRAIRRRVFIEEQCVPEELEWDGHDEYSYHVVVLAPDGMPVGTGRLLQDGRIGRMSVLKEWRGKGAGKALMDYLLWLAAKMGYEEVKLNAQIHALGFYAAHGFEVDGEEFVEAGIRHVAMKRTTVDTAQES